MHLTTEEIQMPNSVTFLAHTVYGNDDVGHRPGWRSRTVWNLGHRCYLPLATATTSHGRWRHQRVTWSSSTSAWRHRATAASWLLTSHSVHIAVIIVITARSSSLAQG